MSLLGTKSPLLSKGVWGGAVASAMSLLPILKELGALQGDFDAVKVAAVGLAGALIGLWGRLKATKKLAL